MPPFSLNALVVEDHPGSRELLADMLDILGHRSKSVPSAEEALPLIERSPDAFDTLIADIQLPGMSGIALAQAATRINPAIKIVFASGYGYLVADKTDFAFTLLPKPFGLAQLKHALGH